MTRALMAPSEVAGAGEDVVGVPRPTDPLFLLVPTLLRLPTQAGVRPQLLLLPLLPHGVRQRGACRTAATTRRTLGGAK
jgi:hypothetical protein